MVIDSRNRSDIARRGIGRDRLRNASDSRPTCLATAALNRLVAWLAQ